ncbi:MAG: tRNA pseudouridine(38-40) synthase TruA [Verrucomicrobiota bacterium]|nr:tRNA pseudouridine(38-40) synthase TruA [Verrucomicrobiota bacterium]
MIKNFSLKVAYMGTAYYGWQKQPKHHSVQTAIEIILRGLLQNSEISLTCAGRTDAGVHALGQVASFSVDCHPVWGTEKLKRVLNHRLPGDILIRKISEVEDDFSARFSAQAKTYIYVINTSEKKNPFENKRYLSRKDPLNISRIRKAAKLLIGRYDFTSFGARDDRPDESKIREIYSIDIVEKKDFLFFIVTGNAFLYKMVRSIAGFFIDVGRGHISFELIPEILAECKRTNKVRTASPHGLYLAKVYYKPNCWQDRDHLADALLQNFIS